MQTQPASYTTGYQTQGGAGARWMGASRAVALQVGAEAAFTLGA